MALPLIPIVGAIAAPVVLSVLRYMLPFIIVSAIKVLGITAVTWAVSSAITDQIESLVFSYLGGVGSDIYAILAIAGFIDVLNIFIAGWAAALQAKAIFGSFTKMKFKLPSST